MDAVSAYSFTSLAWLGVQAMPLLIWPAFICSMLTPEYQHANLELYFARSLGLAQLTIGVLLICLSGALPLTSMADISPETTSPYADAVILVSAAYHASTAFYTWSRYNATGETGFVLGLAGSATLAAFGLWCLLFAEGSGNKGRISKRTGADKRTSGFPFRNQEADKKKGGKGL